MPPDLTAILRAVDDGDAKAAEELLPIVYVELRGLAARRLADERPGHTLDPTALVHEAYLRLLGPDAADTPQWKGQAHFFGAAAEAMRRILIDSARRRRAARHCGAGRRVELDDAELTLDPPADDPVDLIALDEALARFAQEDPAKAELVRLRYFAGLSIEDAAGVLGISRATAARHWAYARAWLHAAVVGKNGLTGSE